MGWQIELTDEACDWYLSLAQKHRVQVAAAITHLETNGPATGRPTVDSIKGSRHHNLKEPRPRGGNFRLLFIFDPRRTAVILLGGDKSGNFAGCYEDNVRAAEDLYDVYLEELEQEGLI